MKKLHRWTAGVLSALLMAGSMAPSGFAADGFVPTKRTSDGVLVGDVNKDNEVNGKDRVILARYVAGWDGYDAQIQSMTVADINGDNEVNGKDRVILARFVAGWDGYEAYFEAEKYPLYVGDIQVTSDNQADIFGDSSAYYLPSVNTLYLDNADIVSGDPISYKGNEPFKIVLKGETFLKPTRILGTTIYSTADLTIEGEPGASLTISGPTWSMYVDDEPVEVPTNGEFAIRSKYDVHIKSVNLNIGYYSGAGIYVKDADISAENTEIKVLLNAPTYIIKSEGNSTVSLKNTAIHNKPVYGKGNIIVPSRYIHGMIKTDGDLVLNKSQIYAEQGNDSQPVISAGKVRIASDNSGIHNYVELKYHDSSIAAGTIMMTAKDIIIDSGHTILKPENGYVKKADGTAYIVSADGSIPGNILIK